MPRKQVKAKPEEKQETGAEHTETKRLFQVGEEVYIAKQHRDEWKSTRQGYFGPYVVVGYAHPNADLVSIEGHGLMKGLMVSEYLLCKHVRARAISVSELRRTGHSSVTVEARLSV